MHVLFLLLLLFSLCSGGCHKTERVISVQAVLPPSQHSEGPHWSASEQALYYVDISGQALHRYQPEIDLHTCLQLNDTVNAVIPIKGQSSKFVIGYGTDIVVLDWDGFSDKYTLKTIFKVEPDKPLNRFNDGKADSNGRFWIGSMAKDETKNKGSLYRVSSACNLKTMQTSVSISNGITWSLDDKLMYYIDSPTRKVVVFDYNIETGTPSNKRVFYDFDIDNITGVPDGMTIDRDGHLWVACWNGSKVIRISSQGDLMSSINFPVERVTSVAWGGRDLTTLFVTTMYKGLSKEERKKQPLAGSVFAVQGLATAGHSGGHPVSSCYVTHKF